MEANKTPTQWIEAIQQNIDDADPKFKEILNQYIIERDNLNQRANKFKNDQVQYRSMDKRTKAAKDLKQQLQQDYINIQKDKQKLINKLVKLNDDIISDNTYKEIDELEQNMKKERINKFKSVKPIKPKVTKEQLKHKRQLITK